MEQILLLSSGFCSARRGRTGSARSTIISYPRGFVNRQITQRLSAIFSQICAICLLTSQCRCASRQTAQKKRPKPPHFCATFLLDFFWSCANCTNEALCYCAVCTKNFLSIVKNKNSKLHKLFKVFLCKMLNRKKLKNPLDKVKNIMYNKYIR